MFHSQLTSKTDEAPPPPPPSPPKSLLIIKENQSQAPLFPNSRNSVLNFLKLPFFQPSLHPNSIQLTQNPPIKHTSKAKTYNNNTHQNIKQTNPKIQILFSNSNTNPQANFF